ncbi:hypothetical protein DP114_02470 [Brasilonema sennae CENA114]|uniref:Uncharacterized protein n=1 Tax=Brasilonema sennae CENA114 TaxID=415709 RepID=A0A856M971_9CYAN|nr:hypothetical protein DP114_02470 [Brasilonema sennae CENA114]
MATSPGGWLHNALNPTPFGFASRLRRETLLQRWSHQIPLSGNPHQGLAPSGFTSRLRRETRSVCVAPPMPAARLRRSRAAGIGGATQTEAGFPP